MGIIIIILLLSIHNPYTIESRDGRSWKGDKILFSLFLPFNLLMTQIRLFLFILFFDTCQYNIST